MTDYQAWMKIARDAERKGPPFGGSYGLCYAALGLGAFGQYKRMKAAVYAYFPEGDDGKNGLYFWPRTAKGWEQRVIAATLLAELSRDPR